MRFRHFACNLTVLAALAVAPLAGCGDTKTINEKVEATDQKVSKAMTTFDPKEVNNSPLTVSKRPWYGQQAISINSGAPLPVKFTAADSITLTFDQALTLRQTANLIQSVTGIRTIVNENAAAEAGATTTEERGFLPINGREVRGNKMIWQGALDDLLNQIADNFDAGWSYDGAAITLNQEITKTFMLHALATVVSDTSKVESGSGDSAGGGGLPSVTTSGTTELKVWEEVKSVVDSMVSGRGRATFSPSTGTITVTGSPSAIKRVEDYLRFQNEMRLRRIAVSVKVLELTLAQTVNTGVSTTQLLENILSNGNDLSISSTTEGLSAAFIKSNRGLAGGSPNNDDITTTITASKDVDRVSIVHSGSVVTMSDQPAPLQVGRQISYLKSRSSTGGTSDTAGTETLEPGTVDIGLIMNVLPRVVEDDRVMLRLNVALTDTDQPFPTFPADPGAANSIQLPEIDTTGFQQNTVLRSGETLVLAGFERNENSTSDSGVPGFSFLLGGTRGRTQSRQVTVMLITANILPEDPVSVYSDNR